MEETVLNLVRKMCLFFQGNSKYFFLLHAKKYSAYFMEETVLNICALYILRKVCLFFQRKQRMFVFRNSADSLKKQYIFLQGNISLSRILP